MKPYITIILAGLVALTACEKAKKENSGFASLPYIDTSVKPADNFFRYVNGKWLDSVQIPDDRASWGSFHERNKMTDEEVLGILERTANKAIDGADKNKDADAMKAVYLFETALDTVSRNQRGLSPLKPFLEKIDAIRSAQDLQKFLAQTAPFFSLGFINSGVNADLKDSNKNAVYVDVPSLGLSDREYYVSDTPDNLEKRKLYTEYLSNEFKTFFQEDESTAQKDAQTVLSLETEIAKAVLDRVALRDDYNTYHPMSVADAQKLMPDFDLPAYLQEIGLPKPDTVIVTQPEYFKTFEKILKTRPIDDWKTYLRNTLFRETASQLTTDAEKFQWEFYSKTLAGSKKQKPAKERALDVVNKTLGEALGKLYVSEKFPPEAKIKAQKMVAYLLKSFEERIKALHWMTDSTKQKALEKLHTIRIKIGYPDKWEDFSQMNVKSKAEGGAYFENLQNASLWHHNKNMSEYGKPVDKDKWFMSPQAVNAYYNPSYNEIVFPAAILQEPFYSYTADEALNFGGIGAVIGHEISHGFDDSGSQYDAQGNLMNWWTASDREKFTALGDALAKQFSEVEIFPGISIDGKFTLGENIGDLGGLCAAFDALQLYLKDNGSPGLINGLTPEQRFFISWATVWRTKSRDEALKRQVKTDPHSPGMYRAYMPLRNIEAFYEAFNIKPGDSLYLPPEKRVEIW